MTFTDPPEMETGDIDALTDQLLADPLERTAIVLWNMGHMTPEEVGVKLSTDPYWLVHAWCGGPGVGEFDRHLYRRRAAMVLQAHAGKVDVAPDDTEPLFEEATDVNDGEGSAG